MTHASRPFHRAALACAATAISCFAEPPSGPVDVRDHGAKGDGSRLDTQAIQAAVDVCAARGGGTVLLPAGTYPSGTLHLAGNLRFELAPGAVLLGSTNLGDYVRARRPDGRPVADPSRWRHALLSAEGVTNLVICGPGTIDGNRVFDPEGEEKTRGPHAFLFHDCRNVTVTNVTFRDAGNYAIFFHGSDEVKVRDARFLGGYDGIHFRGREGAPCRDVSIDGCRFETGDDAIAGAYWSGVSISNCRINSSCNGIRLIGPATDLAIARCDFRGPGLFEHRTSHRTNMLAAFCLQPGAWMATTGTLDRVKLSDCTVSNVTTPFHFVLKPGNESGSILVERIRAWNAYATACSVESWSDRPFSNVVFRDVSVVFAGGKTNRPPLKTRPPGVDARPLPVWGLYARNVTSLTLENVRLETATPDARPAMLFEKVGVVTLDRATHSAGATGEEPIVFQETGRIERR